MNHANVGRTRENETRATGSGNSIHGRWGREGVEKWGFLYPLSKGVFEGLQWKKLVSKTVYAANNT